MVRLSAKAGLSADVRRAYERLAVVGVTRFELIGLAVQWVVGVSFLVLSPVWLKQGFMHGKLTCVVLLSVLAHLEMKNVKAIARLEGDDAHTTAERAKRKGRHEIFGRVGGVLVLAAVALVTLGR
jgi:uncharacterized membrane protein